jgi:hypothetical protein
LFVGYVLMQIPSNMLITKINPAIYMSSWMVVWYVAGPLPKQHVLGTDTQFSSGPPFPLVLLSSTTLLALLRADSSWASPRRL